MRGRTVASAALWVLGLALLLAYPAHAPSRGQAELQGPAFEAEWLKSGDPCLPVKKRKEWVKKAYGQGMPYLKCIPLLITLNYDLEETYRHHSDYGTDRFNFSCQESFPAHLQIYYDQKKRDMAESFLIVGPAPCCPGDVELGVDRADSTFLICTHGVGEKCKTFSTSDVWKHVVAPPKDSFLEFSWSRPGSITFQRAHAAIGAPGVGLAQDVVPKPYFNKSEVWRDDSYDVKVEGDEALSWDELRPHIESQEPLRLEFPIERSTVFDHAAPFIESHAVKGKLAVQIEFGEQEKEEWRVTVLGHEKDPIGGVIEYTAPDKMKKSLPVNVEFDWLLEGTFWVKRIKKVATYATGRITAYSQTPRIVFGAPDLFDCFLTVCQGKKASEEAGKYADTFLFGSLEGQAVKLAWPGHPAEACIVCTPKKHLKSKAPYRHQFGTREFISIINKERIPLKDGATVNGRHLDWMDYSITLKRVK